MDDALIQTFHFVLLEGTYTLTHFFKKATKTLQKHVRKLLFFYGSVCFFFDFGRRVMVQKFLSTRTFLRSVPARASHDGME
jgi:hypothetical protein